MNEAPVLLQIALRIGGLSLVAVGGGNALIPALHQQAVGAMHWLSDSTFAESVALSQAAPGPNMLLLPLVGWQTAGVAGALVALVAFLVPSSTIAIVGARFIVRHESSPIVGAFKWALRPVAGGLMLSSGIVLVGNAIRTWPYPSLAASLSLGATAVVVAVLSLRFKVNPLVWLAAAALAGALAA